ncbi:12644_t:CDS:2 [Gigaspora rosea]|nr:12644_t:CDS:2 [Gigaspora rosea]
MHKLAEKHAKCSGKATCERCALRNLECIFIDSGKKRGPKTDGKYSVQVYVPNGSENDFDGISMLSSVIPNPVQEFYDPEEQVYILNNFENNFDGTYMLYSITPNPVQNHASALSGYPQQQLDNFDDATLYSDSYEEKITNAFQNQ